MSEKYCKKCGERLTKILLLALLVQTGGARVTPAPDECIDGGEHEWVYDVEVEESE